MQKLSIIMAEAHAMNYKNIIFTQHAFQRMFSRSITPDLVKKAIRQGEIIENYPDDTPHPSFLHSFHRW
jgi:hypothetical protein